MCGEQNQLLMDQVPIPGSPPRVRGTVYLRPARQVHKRITPACAGNSFPPAFMGAAGGDHPRVCGEQPNKPFGSLVNGGSPPRVRGTGALYRDGRRKQRITPACAGNRSFAEGYTAESEDHPRVCGEQTKKSPSFLHSFLSDQENSFSLKYNCSISSQSFCARWTSLQGSSKCFAKVDS